MGVTTLCVTYLNGSSGKERSLLRRGEASCKKCEKGRAVRTKSPTRPQKSGQNNGFALLVTTKRPMEPRKDPLQTAGKGEFCRDRAQIIPKKVENGKNKLWDT